MNGDVATIMSVVSAVSVLTGVAYAIKRLGELVTDVKGLIVQVAKQEGRIDALERAQR